MAYFTLDEYLAKWGEAEAIRLTDEDGTGQPDPFAYDEAAAAADATVDAYLAGRYALPLPTVPPLVKSIAADLVREKLHASFPTEAVKAQADLARRQLGDLATGKATLILPDATAAVENLSGSGIRWTARSTVFDADSLQKF